MSVERNTVEINICLCEALKTSDPFSFILFIYSGYTINLPTLYMNEDSSATCVTADCCFLLFPLLILSYHFLALYSSALITAINYRRRSVCRAVTSLQTL